MRRVHAPFARPKRKRQVVNEADQSATEVTLGSQQVTNAPSQRTRLKAEDVLRGVHTRGMKVLPFGAFEEA
eukprot:11293778-Heterocapsa_arctica.AAC.1